jgi:hypothetical protein
MAENTTDNILSAKQYNAIAALLSEASVRQAAAVAKVPERTLYRWLKAPLFQAEYRTARRDAVGQAIARTQQYSSAMVGVLLSIAADAKKPAPARIAAAAKVIDVAIKSVELEDLAARLDALERAYAAKL